MAGLEQGDAGCDLEATCASNHEESGNGGELDGLDEALADGYEFFGVVWGRGVGAYDGV
jgi:hypothetical protein